MRAKLRYGRVLRMANIEPSVWFPVVTLVVGFATKWISDLFQNRWAAQRERDNRLDQRRDAARHRRVGFQRETLLALQDGVAKLVRATGKAHHQDVMAYRSSGKWKKAFLGGEVSEEFLKAQVATSTLRVRVLDEQVRELCKTVLDRCVSILFAPDERTALDEMMSMIKALSALNERIGDVLRNLDSEEA
jgi:hypothetical protein